MMWDGGFQILLILDLWRIRFYAVVVFGLAKNLLFKSILGHCVPSFFKHKNLSVTAMTLNLKQSHWKKKMFLLFCASECMWLEN